MRILIINDVGFLGGAGIATRRQVQSLLMLGHDVMLLCHDPLQAHAAAFETDASCRGRWLGLKSLPNNHRSSGVPTAISSQRICAAAGSARPDVIIVGNIHGAGWSAGLLIELRRLKVPIIAYLHDLHFMTGRCAYPYGCEMHLTGCNATCPTASEYPPLAPDLIHEEWQLRRQVFCGTDAAHAACNSTWTMNMFQRSMPAAASVSLLHLGLDKTVFKPRDRAEARRTLGIPQNRFVVVSAAMKFMDPQKGGGIFQEVARRLSGLVHFVALGGGTESVTVDQSFPQSGDLNFLVDLYAAADIFLSTSTAESFGQTLLEAASCGRSVVAMKVGGIPDVVQNGVTGMLVDPDAEQTATDALVDRIQAYQRDSAMMHEHGAAARRFVEEHFDLEAQARRWEGLLNSVNSP